MDNTRSSFYGGTDFQVFQSPGGMLSFLKHSQHAMARKRAFVLLLAQGGKLRCSWEKQEASSQQDSKENLYYTAACGCVCFRTDTVLPKQGWDVNDFFKKTSVSPCFDLRWCPVNLGVQ